MKIAVLSGKGGTGKTFVSVNLAYVQQDAVYVDCDVEAPNGGLFLPLEQKQRRLVSVPVPRIDESRCDGCGRCVDFCQHDALEMRGGKIVVHDPRCHHCSGCRMVCPQQAVEETAYLVGEIEQGSSGGVRVVSGCMTLGECSSAEVIRQLQEQVRQEPDVVFDCPPGCSGQVIQSIRDAELCVLVVEPTLFGMHDMEMVYDLVRRHNKPLGIVINKSYDVRNYAKTFCRKNHVPVLGEIPYSEELARNNAEGRIAARLPEYEKIFRRILKNTQAAAHRE